MSASRTATTRAAKPATEVDEVASPGYVELYRRVFGLGDLDGVERQLAELNLRDARWRTVAVVTEPMAMDALAGAERHGDVAYVKAVASKAFLLGWTAVLAAFAEFRPGVAEDLELLRRAPAPLPPAMPAAAVVSRHKASGDEGPRRIFRMDEQGGLIDEIDSEGRPVRRDGLPRGGAGAVFPTRMKD